MNKPNILLTGATGFIGRQFIRQVGVARSVIRGQESLSDQNCFIIDELNGNTCWQGAFDDIDVVIHLAGLAHSTSHTKDDFQRVNVEGTITLAKQAVEAGVRRFVFISSIGVNGQSTQKQPFSPACMPFPHNDYAMSKYEAEKALTELGASSSMEIVIVRPTLVYGPNAPGNFSTLSKLVQYLPLIPFGLVNNKRHFISVQNLCDLLLHCTTVPQAAGQVFLAAEKECISTKEFTNAIAKGLGKQVWQLPLPVFLMKLAATLIGKPSLAEQLFGNLEVDTSNIETMLNWKASYTLEQSMAFLSENT